MSLRVALSISNAPCYLSCASHVLVSHHMSPSDTIWDGPCAPVLPHYSWALSYLAWLCQPSCHKFDKFCWTPFVVCWNADSHPISCRGMHSILHEKQGNSTNSTWKCNVLKRILPSHFSSRNIVMMVVVYRLLCLMILYNFA